MALDPKSKFLCDRAVRALGANRVEDAVAKVRAIIGPASIPASEPLAQAALDKLRQGEIPTPEELRALEIVVRLLRPVVFSRNGALEDLPDRPGQNLQPQDLKDAWTDFRTKMAPLIHSIGRVENTRGEHIGTGFLVGDGLLATNRHVLADLTFGTEVLGADQARVVFKREAGSTDPSDQIVKILGVAGIHPNLDMVLLEVPKLGRPAVEVDSTSAPDGTRVVAIGYPANDPQRNPLFLSSVFPPPFGVRRAALGEVLDGSAVPTLYHDCSTLGGNSGSPVFSLMSGKVIGLHKSGYFMYRNEAVDGGSVKAFVP